MRTRILGGMLAFIIGSLMFTHATLAVGPIVSITIAPTDPVIAAGTAQSFTVTGHDAAGVTADLTADAVFTMTDPLGAVKANAYTAGKSGTWVISGSYNNLTAEAKVTVTPGALNEIVVNPNSTPEFLTVGASRSFTAEAFDVHNNVLRDAEVQWTVTGDIGTVKNVNATSTKFTATKTGKGTLVARIGETAMSVNVTVTAAPVANSNVNNNPNSNTAASTNVNTPTNVNATNNTNANTAVVTNANVSDDNVNTAATSTSSCKGWPRATWIWLFVAYVVLLVGGLYPIRKSRPTWWWAIPLVLTVAIIWVYYQFRCYPVFPAYPYLSLLAAITVISWFNWQQPPTALPKQ